MEEITTANISELEMKMKPLSLLEGNKAFNHFDYDCESFESSVSDNESEKIEPIHSKDMKRNKFQEAKILLDISKKQNNRITEQVHDVIKTHYVELLKSQSASRSLQLLMNSTESWILNEIFVCIQGSLKQLLTNVYSNYFCHKLFGKIEKAYQKSFLIIICDNMHTISCDKTGTFSIQKIFEQINSNETTLLYLICEKFHTMTHSELDLMLRVIQYFKLLLKLE